MKMRNVAKAIQTVSKQGI